MWNNKIKSVHWEPTDNCNAGCAMCPRYDSLGFTTKTLTNSEWTLDNFIKSWPVEFIKDLTKILSCGNFGDPCACKELAEIYQYCREINPSMDLCINTNGSLRNKSWWSTLGSVMTKTQSQGNYCTFSLDGLEDTNHLYRRNTNWKKIMENATAYIEAGGLAHWDFIVFEHNEHQIDEARNLAVKMGFENFNIKRTTRWHKYVNNQGIYPVFSKGKYLYDLKQPKESKFKPNFEDSDLIKNRNNYQSITLEDFKNLVGKTNYQIRFINNKWEKLPTNELTIACRSVSGGKRRVLLDEIFISADGSVAPCCYLGSEPFHDPEKRIADQNYLKLVELQGGLSRLNMLQHNLYDILKLDIFQKWIPNTWEENGNRSMRPDKCGACCGIEFNALDFGELGDKKNGNIKKNEVNINASQ